MELNLGNHIRDQFIVQVMIELRVAGGEEMNKIRNMANKIEQNVLKL